VHRMGTASEIAAGYEQPDGGVSGMSTAVVAPERRASQFDLPPALFLELLHSMLLIVEHGRRKGKLTEHANVGKRDHDHALGVLGLDVAHDSAEIARVRDFRDGLAGLDDYRVLLSRQMVDQVGHQADLKWHRRIKDFHEFVSLLWLIEHGVTVLILSVMIRLLPMIENMAQQSHSP
jgi:hypothetical protein